MKIYGDRLGAELAKGLAKLYLLTGDEPLLMQEAGDEIRAAARAAGVTERQLHHADAPGFDWSQFAAEAGSASLFADRRLLEVRVKSAKLEGDATEALQAAAAKLDEGSALLIVMPRVDAATQKRKWFTALEAQGLFIQIWPIEAARLPGWLAGRFKKRGLTASPEATQLMAERIEGNLLAAVQEIEQLRLAAGEGEEVTAEMVEASVADSARYDVFKLIDAALAGDQPRVARMAQGLKAEGAEPLFLVNMLAREVRALERMACQLRDGQQMSAVLSAARIWKNRMDPVRRCLERTSAKRLRRCQLALGQIDRVVKGLEPGAPWRQLTSALLHLAGLRQ